MAKVKIETVVRRRSPRGYEPVYEKWTESIWRMLADADSDADPILALRNYNEAVDLYLRA